VTFIKIRSHRRTFSNSDSVEQKHYNGNKKIRKEPLESLIQLTNTEVNSCYKISEKHITVEKSKRQNVRLAAELLSRNTAEALLRYKPGPDEKLAEHLGMFIDDINC
jgi:hypothetical protein